MAYGVRAVEEETGKPFSVSYHLVATGGASGDIPLYTPSSANFKTNSIYVSFPAGTYSELEISIRKGSNQVAPGSGVYVGDSQVIEDRFKETFVPGETVVLHYKNNNSSQTREAFVIVRGFLE